MPGLDSMGEHVTSGEYAECGSVRLRFHIWLIQSPLTVTAAHDWNSFAQEYRRNSQTGACLMRQNVIGL